MNDSQRSADVVSVGTEDLAGHDLFARLSEHGRRELLALFGPRQTVPDGEVVCREGTVADTWWAVLHGTADVTVGGVYVASVGPGEIIGDLSLLDGDWRSATVTAREQLVVTELPAEAFERCLDEVPGFERALLRQLAARLRSTTRRVPSPPTHAASDPQLPALPDDLLSVLLDPAFHQDPHPFYAALREGNRLRWEATLEFWIATRYDEVRLILRDRRFGSDPSMATPTALLSARSDIDRELGDVSLMTHRDGPDHMRVRRLFAQVLMPNRLDSWRSETRDMVAELLASGRERGQIDLVADVAVTLPTQVISRLLGVPTADEAQLHSWSLALADIGAPMLDPSRRAEVLESGRALMAYLGDQIQGRRSRPGDDALSELVSAASASDVTDSELLHNTVLLYVAGHMTTASLIACGFAALIAHPDQWGRLRDDPGLIPNAVEEFLRFDAPVPFVRRYALEDVGVGDAVIRAGQSVVVCPAAANRDSRQFGADADRLRLDRPGAHEHLSFAAGRHFCVGSGLARIEAQATFEGALRTWAELSPVDPTVSWQQSFVGRLPVSLRVQA
jgi:cytochrome P450